MKPDRQRETTRRQRGHTEEQAPEWVSGGSWQIQFHSLPQGLWAVGFAALAVTAIGGVWYLYRGESSNVGLATRLLLVCVRGLVLTCVAFMLLELVLVITKHESTPSRLVVLLDTSESMALNDPYPEDEAHSSLAGKLGFDGPAAIRKQSRLALGQRALEKKRSRNCPRGGKCLFMASRKSQPRSSRTKLAPRLPAGAKLPLATR